MYKSYGDKTKRILQELRHHTRTTREIIEALVLTDPDTFKVTKRLLGYTTKPKFDYKYWKRQEEKRFYTLLAKLRKEGLVEKRKLYNKIIWHNTAKGIKKLLNYKNQNLNKKLPHKKYKKIESKHTILIIFDIPEKWRSQRAWLRRQLANLEFNKLQQSVWIGTHIIPADFIYDLKEINLLKYIHIFKVTKTGSIIE
jgi:DNA-binding PadR family transcriptional regulator